MADILREPTAREDVDKYASPVYDAIKMALMMGGGVSFGVPGAVLGNAGGQTIKDFYKTNMFGKNATDPYAIPKAGLEGATAEMGGQVLSKVIPKIVGALSPKVQKGLSDIFESENDIPIIQKHGSDKTIEQPLAGLTQTGTKGPNVFFTSKDTPLAKTYAENMARQFDNIKAGVDPKGVINEYYMSKGNQFNLETPVNKETAFKLGKMAGLNDNQIKDAIINSSEKGQVDADTFWNNVLFKMSENSGEKHIQTIGNSLVNALKNNGYTRLLQNTSAGFPDKEMVHFYPEQDLYQVGGKRAQALLDSLNKKPVEVNQSIEPLSKLAGYLIPSLQR